LYTHSVKNKSEGELFFSRESINNKEKNYFPIEKKNFKKITSFEEVI
jgi:hypothetical protein